MAKAQIDLTAVGGGGARVAISKNLAVSATNIKPYDNTPFKARQVYVVMEAIYNNSLVYARFTNFNPTTGELTTNSCWQSADGGNTWSENNQRYFTITDTSVTYSSSLSGATAHKVQYFITDGEFELS